MYNPNKNDNDELDLSEMINEYENDGSLRNKIEALKKEKLAQEQRVQEEQAKEKMKEEELSRSSALYVHQPSAKEDMDTLKDNDSISMNIIDIQEDDLDKTMIAGPNVSDADKTLVIMDNQKQKSFHETSELYDDEYYTEDDEEDVMDSDFEEEDFEKAIPTKDEKQKKVDIEKRNKIITYICIGATILCLIGLGIFGWFMLSPSDTDDKKEEETTTIPDDKDNDNDVEKDPIEEDNGQTDIPVDNSAEKDTLNAEIATYEAQLTAAREKLNEANVAYNNANSDIESTTSRKTNVESAYNAAVKALNENKDESKKAELEKAKTKAKEDLEAAQNAVDDATDRKKKAGNDQTTALNDIARIEKEIQTRRTQLSNL